jgi:hypothetical protein
MVNPELPPATFHVSIHYLPRNQYLEFTMTEYMPALIWALSSVACLLIAKRRHIRTTAIRAMLVALLGPIAIPFVLAAKPEKFNHA